MQMRSGLPFQWSALSLALICAGGCAGSGSKKGGLDGGTEAGTEGPFVFPDSGFSPPKDPPAPTVEDFARQEPIAFCEALATCADSYGGVDPSKLAVALAGACGDFVQPNPNLEDLFALGHSTLDSQAAKECLAGIRSCLERTARCEKVMIGTLPVGEGCLIDLECASHHCERLPDSRCGTCTKPIKPLKQGQNCTHSLDCAEVSGEQVLCASYGDGTRKCAVVTAVEKGGACESDATVCVAGTFCDVNRRCIAVREAGHTCTNTDRCERGSVCVGELGSERCAPLILRGKGAECTPGFAPKEGRFDVCDPKEGLVCDEDSSTCVPLVPAREGKACSAVQTCETGLRCDRTARCVKLTENGEACSSPTECASRRCVSSLCAASSIPDCSAPDAGSPDAGSPDAGSPDAGSPDAGSPAGDDDAGTADAGT